MRLLPEMPLFAGSGSVTLTMSPDFQPLVFRQSTPLALKYFQISFRIRRDIPM
jgi:hypothetical protein